MWIVAIGWIYVVILMAATETSVIAGVMTFLIYCMIPLSILFYLTGSKRRHARRIAAQQAGTKHDDGSAAPASPAATKAPGGADAGNDAGGDGGD
ncbi:hypothetical protein [Massilia niabensis]|uniref:Uncharacterized protein n=1 Tax=Massilia niabensis TaxID=544910 RepID=A0ABW0L6F0_9BURK